MTNITKLDDDIFKALQERGHTNDQIKAMTWDKVFDEYCEWHGLVNWGSELRRVMANAKNASSYATKSAPKHIQAND